MADSGDGLADANFVEDVADSSILRLFNNKSWCEDNVRDANKLRTGDLNFSDKLFDNEINCLVHEARAHYERTDFKLALKSAFFDFSNSRDSYREICGSAGIALHRSLVFKYIELQALVLCPIAPHWAEMVWLEILKKPESIQFARWPQVPAGDAGLTAARDYVRNTGSAIRSAEASQLKKMAKGKGGGFDPKKPKKLSIFLAESFPAWQAKYIELLSEVWDPATNSQKIDDKELSGQIGKMGEVKKAMPFVQSLKKRLKDGESAMVVLSRKLAFDEKETLLEMVPSLSKTAGFNTIQIIAVQEGSKKGKDLGDGITEVDVTAPQAAQAMPGQPAFFFENV